MNKNIGDMSTDELKDFIIELEEENSRYERIIDKALEYINKTKYAGYNFGNELVGNEINHLINILGGKNE